MTLLELLALCRKRIGVLVALPVVFAIAVGAYSFLVMEDSYTATASMYVMVGQNVTGGGYSESSSALQSDLNSSQMITTDVSDLLTSDRVKSDAARQVGLASLDGYDIAVASDTGSRVIDLSVTGADPKTAAAVANALVSSVSGVASEAMGIESVNPVDTASAPSSPSGPKRPLYVAVAALAGLFCAVAVVVLFDMLNTRVRSEDELEELTGLPIMGQIPFVRKGGADHV